MLTETWLQTLTEVELRQHLVSLITAMGRFRHIRVVHGTLEAGRDIIFAEEDPLRRLVWRGIQAKATPLTASLTSSSGYEAVLRQCEHGLERPCRSPTGEVMLAEIWLVCSHPFSEHVTSLMYGAHGTLRAPRIYPIDGKALAALFDEYCPDAALSNPTSTARYRRELALFCDTPTQYVAARLGVTLRTSDVFVRPVSYTHLTLPTKRIV